MRPIVFLPWRNSPLSVLGSLRNPVHCEDQQQQNKLILELHHNLICGKRCIISHKEVYLYRKLYRAGYFQQYFTLKHTEVSIPKCRVSCSLTEAVLKLSVSSAEAALNLQFSSVSITLVFLWKGFHSIMFSYKNTFLI